MTQTTTTERAIRKEAKGYIKAVETAYKATRWETPADTLSALAESIGAENVPAAVATLALTVHPDDGRIARHVKDWATSVTGLTHAALDSWYIYSSIHPAHINQIAGEAEEW